MDISKDDAERIAQMTEHLAQKVRTAGRLPIVESGECVRDGTKFKITVLIEAVPPTYDEIAAEFGHTDMRI